jgi:hypothetical protein
MGQVEYCVAAACLEFEMFHRGKLLREGRLSPRLQLLQMRASQATIDDDDVQLATRIFSPQLLLSKARPVESPSTIRPVGHHRLIFHSSQQLSKMRPRPCLSGHFITLLSRIYPFHPLLLQLQIRPSGSLPPPKLSVGRPLAATRPPTCEA